MSDEKTVREIVNLGCVFVGLAIGLTVGYLTGWHYGLGTGKAIAKYDCPAVSPVAPAGIGKPQAPAPPVKFDNPRLDLNLDGVNILLDCVDLKDDVEISMGLTHLNQCKERIDAWRKREEKMDGPAHPLKLGKRKPAAECSPIGLTREPSVAEINLGYVMDACMPDGWKPVSAGGACRPQCSYWIESKPVQVP